jgi:hypothetical protein
MNSTQTSYNKLLAEIGRLTIGFEDILTVIHKSIISVYGINEIQIISFIEELNAQRLIKIYYNIITNLRNELDIDKGEFLKFYGRLNEIRQDRNNIIHGMKLIGGGNVGNIDVPPTALLLKADSDKWQFELHDFEKLNDNILEVDYYLSNLYLKIADKGICRDFKELFILIK